MILVYPLIRAANDNIELRYSLRSMSHLPIDRVIVIGHRPSWLINAEHYPHADSPNQRYKQMNIYNKLKFGFSLPGVNEFMYCNDDHFVNKSFDPYKYYANSLGNISEMLTRAGKMYKATVQNTIDFIGDVPNFDVHCPIRMLKALFTESFRDSPIYKENGLLIKSMYGNGYPPHPYPNLKVTGWFDPGELAKRDFFSVSDSGLTNYFLFNLQKMWPDKSRFEV